MTDQKQQRPDCAIEGFMRHPSGAMGICGYVIVGDKSCGFDGECPHQRKQTQDDNAQGEKP